MKKHRRSDLTSFFEPNAIAVLGSLKEPAGFGYVTIKNLIHFRFSGKIYPINPSCEEVLGLKVVTSIDTVPEHIDLAVLITPPTTIPTLVEQCTVNGIEAVIVISENFAEAGGKGVELQQQLVDISLRTGIRIMGPNTIGLINTSNNLLISPFLIAYSNIQKGGIAYCSQSGFVSPAAQPLKDKAFPISKMCDIGNKCDVNESDLLEYLSADSETEVVAMHLEDIENGRRFIDTARKLICHKPLLILKSGITEAGGKASASHTGSLAGNEQVYDSAFRQAGAIRVNTWQDFWEVPKVFLAQPLPKGNRIAINTLTGGAGVVAVDTAIQYGLEIAHFSSNTIDKLARISPRLATNPVDMAPATSASKNPIELQEEIISITVNDPNVDCATIPVWIGFDSDIPVFLEMLNRLKSRISKTVVVWVYGMQLHLIAEMSHLLEENGFITYNDVQSAIRALSMATKYSEINRWFK